MGGGGGQRISLHLEYFYNKKKIVQFIAKQKQDQRLYIHQHWHHHLVGMVMYVLAHQNHDQLHQQYVQRLNISTMQQVQQNLHQFDCIEDRFYVLIVM